MDEDPYFSLAVGDAAIAEASTQIRALLKKTPGPDTEAQLEGLRKEVVALHDKVDELAKTLNEWRETESTAKQKAEEIKGDLIRVRSEVSSDTEALRRVQTEIQALRTSLGTHADVAIVRAELKKQNDAKQELDVNTHLKETESDAFSKAKDVLAESSRILEGLKVKGDELERTRTRLNKNIEQHQVLLSSAFPKLKIEAVGLERDPAAQLEHQSQALQTQREVIQKKILQQEEEIKTLSIQIKRAADMRKEIDHHRSEAAVAHDLAQALRGDQFIALVFLRVTFDTCRAPCKNSMNKHTEFYEANQTTISREGGGAGRVHNYCCGARRLSCYSKPSSSTRPDQA